MPIWQFITGIVVLIAAWAAIILMIYAGCMTVIRDVEKDAKRDAEQLAKILAERKYRKMLATTEYHVHIGMRVVDEMKGE